MSELAPIEYVLQVLEHDGSVAKEIEFAPGALELGRRGADLSFPDDTEMADRHAYLTLVEDRVVIGENGRELWHLGTRAGKRGALSADPRSDLVGLPDLDHASTRRRLEDSTSRTGRKNSFNQFVFRLEACSSAARRASYWTPQMHVSLDATRSLYPKAKISDSMIAVLIMGPT